jgi:hypothetical protein
LYTTSLDHSESIYRCEAVFAEEPATTNNVRNERMTYETLKHENENSERKEKSFERVEKSQRHRLCTSTDSAGDEPAKQPLLDCEFVK